ncbi:MAG: M48 family metalloprotease [Theionarchaea archaeon]|nr:M48 family metalloprotease [Theionarchaea archaeon]
MKTALLMGVVTGLFMAIGCIIGLLLCGYFGVSPLYLAVVFAGLAVIVNGGVYTFSDRIMLRMYDTTVVSENIAPELYSKVSQLSMKAGLPMPKIGIINNESPNSFATGRAPENAVIAVTSGALSLLQRDELEGVLAHELGHIKNGDMFISTLAAVTASTVFLVKWLWTAESKGLFTQVRRLFLFVLVLPASLLIRLAVSVNYEFAADETGAKISEKPNALADALIRIEESVMETPMLLGNPAASHVFIVNPFKADTITHLLCVSPPLERRVQTLREMAHLSS